MNSELRTRIITGLIFVSVMISSIVYSENTFLIIFGLLIILSVNEYYSMLERRIVGSEDWKFLYKILNTFFGTIIFGVIFLVASAKIDLIYISVIAAFPLIWLLIEMYHNTDSPFLNVCFNVMAVFYIVVPFASASFLVFDRDNFTYHSNYLLAVMIFAWVNDSFAYLVGRKFGKNKLYPRLSPKKTWEGTIGGAIAAVLFSGVLYILFPKLGYSEVSLFHYFMMAVITAVMSTNGDLAESMIKRNLDIKDTGNTLPGHGGFLDRFDGLLFSLPANVLYIIVAGI